MKSQKAKENQKKEPAIKCAEDVERLAVFFTGRGYSVKWSGLCFWITRKISDRTTAEALENMGACFSEKKELYYFRAAEYKSINVPAFKRSAA